MNRVLSFPIIPILPDLLEALKTQSQKTIVTARKTVRIENPLGAIEAQFVIVEQQLEPGTLVRVWWKGGGLVCASIEELNAEKQQRHYITTLVTLRRAQLAKAREARKMSRMVISSNDSKTLSQRLFDE